MNARQNQLLAALRARTDNPTAQLGLIYTVARGIDGVRQHDIEVVREAIVGGQVREGAG